MATFRTSIIPEWSGSGYERDGYYNPRSPRLSEAPSSPQKEQFGNMPTSQQKYFLLPSDLRQAEIQVKLSRLLQAMWLACSWQLLLILPFSFVFVKGSLSSSPLMYWLGFSFLYNVGTTFVLAVVSVPSLILAVLAYFTLFMIATCLNSSEHYPESLHEQIKRYLRFRFLLKPLSFGLISWFHCQVFLHLFDASYGNLFLVKETSTDDKVLFFDERWLIVRIAPFITGLEFFFYNYVFNNFHIKYPSARVKSPRTSLLRIDEMLSYTRESLQITICIWTLCLLFGPLFYSNLFVVFGIQMHYCPLLDRIVGFLDVTFVFRIFVWVCIPRVTLRMYLKLVNSVFTDIINMPIEYPAGNKQCLLMSQAMNGKNSYLKFQSFYEFKWKARIGNPDVKIFFNITHPGNHPINWKGIFGASCQVLDDMNESVIKFLKTAKLPPTLLQGGFHPSILNQLRKSVAVTPAPAVQAKASVTTARLNNMRDLASNRPTEVPAQLPTVYDLIKQFPNALLNDLKDVLRGLFTMQNINNLLFFGKLETKMPERELANLLSQGVISAWALEGTLELICISIDQDPRGIVHQDLQFYIQKIITSYDALSVLEFYMINSLERDLEIDRAVFDGTKALVSKLISAAVFVLAKLDSKFSSCYRILNVDGECQSRVESIIASRAVRF